MFETKGRGGDRFITRTLRAIRKRQRYVYNGDGVQRVFFYSRRGNEIPHRSAVHQDSYGRLVQSACFDQRLSTAQVSLAYIADSEFARVRVVRGDSRTWWGGLRRCLLAYGADSFF